MFSQHPDYDPMSSKEQDRDSSGPSVGSFWNTASNSRESLDIQVREPKKSVWYRLTLGLLPALSAVLLAGSVAAVLYAGDHAPRYDVLPARLSLQTCGPTAATARERGCHFDLMSASWVQSDCFEKEVMHEYVHDGFNTRNWTFWWDNNGEAGAQMTKREVLSGEWEIIWASGDYHHAHCAYFWEKQWRQFRTGGPVVVLDSRIRFPHHTKHCIDLVRMPNVTYIQGQTSAKINQQFGRLECIVGPM